MSFDLTEGSVYFTPQALSYTVTDKTITAEILRSSFASETDATDFYALWTSTDVTKCRFCKNDQTTELAFDIYEYDLTTGSEYINVSFLWDGEQDFSGTYGFYFMPALDGNTSYAVTDTYGRNNTYRSTDLLYWPSGGGTDRTGNGYDATETGSVIVGDTTGQLGLATSCDGTDDGVETTLPDITSGSLSFEGWYNVSNANYDSPFLIGTDSSNYFGDNSRE